MNKKNIVKTFIELCSSVNSDKELVRGYIKIFSEEIKKFGKAKCDDMDQPMVTLYNYIDSWEFKKECYECDNILWNLIDNMVTYAEVYVWHKDDENYADDNRIKWIKRFLD